VPAVVLVPLGDRPTVILLDVVNLTLPHRMVRKHVAVDFVGRKDTHETSVRARMTLICNEHTAT